MLELQHISYEVEQDGDNKGILRDINVTISERFVAITGPNGGGKSTLAKVIAGIVPLPKVEFSSTGRTSRTYPLPTGPGRASALPFSSRCALRD